ncbi:LemA family protein [uncultured Robinsoniella sp.]|uniref:LemA family protein n=1 Tax=uncultured Robinsoniella sp. TaxID=904190 RepID=UPI00374E7A4C
MKRSGSKIAVWVIIGILVILVVVGVSQYNSLVGINENVENQRANIDTMLQRRVDLIPNLVNTVKGYAEHEKEVIENVSNARAKLAGATSMEDKADADNQLSGALSRLLMVVENYPDLKANQQFIALSDELAGTENRIAVARKDYNDSVKVYNQKIRRFPSNIFANLLGFEKAEYFQAAEGAQQVPEVNFEGQ